MKNTSSALPAGTFLEALLPLPPSINEAYATVPVTKADGTAGTRRVATRKLVSFKEEGLYRLSLTRQKDMKVIDRIYNAKQRGEFTPIKIEAIFFFKTMWKRDEDGPVKALQDLVFQFLLVDDRLATDLHVRKRMDPDHPRCLVRLSIADLSGGEEW